jgi:hypothetical protein
MVDSLQEVVGYLIKEGLGMAGTLHACCEPEKITLYQGVVGHRTSSNTLFTAAANAFQTACCLPRADRPRRVIR